jgi:hypothetical protein
MSRGFLRPTPYSTINLEVDVGGAAAPSQSVVDAMFGVLSRETGKPVAQAGGHVFAGRGSGCWSGSDISAAISQRRTRTTGATASLLALFVDGSYCPDSNVIALALAATSILVFSGQVESRATSSIGPDKYMTAVSIHELGHVLGLVNLGYQSRINHEDAAHPYHSTSQDSVMSWAIDRGSLIQQFTNGPPETFDANDEADLAGLRDGTY